MKTFITFLFQINNVLLNFLFIKESLSNCVSRFPQKYYAAQLFLALIIIRNATTNHKRIIPEGDTEDWSNGCGKFSFKITGINDILIFTKMQNSYFTF